MRKGIVWAALLAAAGSLLAAGCGCGGVPLKSEKAENKYMSYVRTADTERGISWPEGQLLPAFARPADQVDAISITAFTPEEQITATALQGLVNKEKPRLLLLDDNPDEGAMTWPETEQLGLNVQTHDNAEKMLLIKKFSGEAVGVVLYDGSLQEHYRNLASSVAAVKGLLPMDKTVYEDWRAAGVELAVQDDLTGLPYRSAADIYEYFYRTYWPQAQHRLLISASPGDCQHIRDIASAAGAAVVYLDCTREDEKAVFEGFLADMTPGKGAVMGWYTTERSGITTVTKYGLSTIPADLYSNGTVYGGTSHAIQIPRVPDKPELENKVYIALYISDGDNIQYNQRYMRKLWDQSAGDRGRVPINWTISPALADIGPGLLNYYYTTATEKDCFVCGPSGMGYSMPVNTLEEPGAPAVNFLDSADLLRPYAGLTETYLQRTGLRTVTVWDNLTPEQRQVYALQARHLYGLTVHDWQGRNTVASSVENGGTLVQRLWPCYGGNVNELLYEWDRAIENWDGQGPLFLSSQVSVWQNVKPADIVRLAERMDDLYDGKVEFVRADHYFALYNEANGLPFDLTLSGDLSVDAGGDESDPGITVDGSPATVWEADAVGEQTVTYCLGGVYSLTRCVVRHAEDAGLDPSLNTRDYTVELSRDGKSWKMVDRRSGNTDSVVDIDMQPKQAGYLRIRITDAGADQRARIADVEIYGIKE